MVQSDLGCIAISETLVVKASFKPVESVWFFLKKKKNLTWQNFDVGKQLKNITRTTMFQTLVLSNWANPVQA